MFNPFINFQRQREQREWDQGEQERRECEAHVRIQELNRNFFRGAIAEAQKQGPMVYQILHQLKFALYGNDRCYWVTHHILDMHTVLRTDFTETDAHSLLTYPGNEAPDRSIWPIGVWEIIKLFPGRLADRRRPHGYHDCMVSVAFIYTQDGGSFFSCRRSTRSLTRRELCVISETELVRCLAHLCSIKDHIRKAAHHRRA